MNTYNKINKLKTFSSLELWFLFDRLTVVSVKIYIYFLIGSNFVHSFVQTSASETLPVAQTSSGRMDGWTVVLWSDNFQKDQSVNIKVSHLLNT